MPASSQYHVEVGPVQPYQGRWSRVDEGHERRRPDERRLWVSSAVRVSHSLAKRPANGIDGNAVWEDVFVKRKFLQRFNECKANRYGYDLIRNKQWPC